ncbi:MAG TPA: permease, partial [Treponemataceae bacterium]|nr:permease [Treponemataceae bacterium]
MSADIIIKGVSLTLRQSAMLITDIIPWIVAGALAGACIRKIKRIPFEEKIPYLNSVLAIPAASFSGAASPLCTLGSLPIVTAFLARGLHQGAALAFLASSSIVTPQIALMTAGFLGPRIACMQVAGGFFAGLSAGVLLSLAERTGIQIFRPQDTIHLEEKQLTTRNFIGHVAAQLEYSLFWLVVGVIVSQAAVVISDMSGMSSALSNAASSSKQGSSPGGLFAFFGALLSAPLYSCGGAVLPILAALRAYGIHESFFLAFLICGPATRLRSAAAVGKILTPRALAYY